MDGQNRAGSNGKKVSVELSDIWINFIRYCERLGHAELTRLQIQDGEPISVECVKKKVRFTTQARVTAK